MNLVPYFFSTSKVIDIQILLLLKYIPLSFVNVVCYYLHC